MIRIETVDTVRVLSLDRPKVNAFEAELTAALADAVTAAAEDDSVSSVLLTSTNPKCFSGGLDLEALGRLDEPAFLRFLEDWDRATRALFEMPKPVIAALPGHAIAGGCIVAVLADRVFAAEGGGTIGLSEVRLGVPIPPPNLAMLRYRVPEHAVAELVVTGRAVPMARARELGLVDEIVPAGDLFARGLAEAKELAGYPGRSAALRKLELRKETLERIAAIPPGWRGEFRKAWTSEAATGAREALLASLRRK